MTAGSGERLKHLATGGDNFFPDAVTGDEGDVVARHVHALWTMNAGGT